MAMGELRLRVGKAPRFTGSVPPAAGSDHLLLAAKAVRLDQAGQNRHSTPKRPRIWRMSVFSLQAARTQCRRSGAAVTERYGLSNFIERIAIIWFIDGRLRPGSRKVRMCVLLRSYA